MHGSGLGHWIVRLFIWHEIWRLLRYLWRIHLGARGRSRRSASVR
jgi:hypothetical protein